MHRVTRFLSEKRQSAQFLLVVTLTASFSWTFANTVGLDRPIFVVAGAILATQTTIHQSVKESLVRILTTLLGALVAIWIVSTFGLQIFSITTIVMLSVFLGLILKLDYLSIIQIPAAGLFLFALGSSTPITTQELETRVICLIVGTIIGVIASRLTYQKDSVTAAKDQIVKLNYEIADLLKRVSFSSHEVTTEKAADWLRTSRHLESSLAKASSALEIAKIEARWNPVKNSNNLEGLEETLRKMALSLSQLNGIARSIFDSTHYSESTYIPQKMSTLLNVTSDAFSNHAYIINSKDISPDLHLTTEKDLEPKLTEAKEARDTALNELKSITDTGTWLLNGAILLDATKMVDQLEGDSPALSLDDARKSIETNSLAEEIKSLPKKLRRKIT